MHFCLLKDKQIKNSNGKLYESALTQITHPPNKTITSVPIMRRNNLLHVYGPGGRQHYYVHHFNYVLLSLGSKLCYTKCFGNKCLIVSVLLVYLSREAPVQTIHHSLFSGNVKLGYVLFCQIPIRQTGTETGEE